MAKLFGLTRRNGDFLNFTVLTVDKNVKETEFNPTRYKFGGGGGRVELGFY